MLGFWMFLVSVILGLLLHHVIVQWFDCTSKVLILKVCFDLVGPGVGRGILYMVYGKVSGW